MFNMIVSQGRIADRKSRTILGAARTARALEQQYGVQGHMVGTPALPANDDWRVSLPQAKETLLGLREAMSASMDSGNLSVMVANTCSASLATLPLVARHHPDAVVLWIDAHGDFNTPQTTESGYLGGMVVAAACGLWDSGHGAGLRPEQMILVGARDIDAAEAELLRDAGILIIPPSQATPTTVLHAIGDSPVWIHVDWDVMEPGYVPADYEVPDGLVPEQLREIFSAIPRSQLRGIELAEFQPPLHEASSQAAISLILDIVAPLFDIASFES